MLQTNNCKVLCLASQHLSLFALKMRQIPRGKLHVRTEPQAPAFAPGSWLLLFPQAPGPRGISTSLTAEGA